MHTHIHLHTYTYTYRHAHSHTLIHIHTHMYTHTHVHTHTHSHISLTHTLTHSFLRNQLSFPHTCKERSRFLWSEDKQFTLCPLHSLSIYNGLGLSLKTPSCDKEFLWCSFDASFSAYTTTGEPPPYLFLSSLKPEKNTRDCNLLTESYPRARNRRIRFHSWLDSEPDASLSYMNPCLRRSNRRKKRRMYVHTWKRPEWTVIRYDDLRSGGQEHVVAETTYVLQSLCAQIQTGISPAYAQHEGQQSQCPYCSLCIYFWISPQAGSSAYRPSL